MVFCFVRIRTKQRPTFLQPTHSLLRDQLNPHRQYARTDAAVASLANLGKDTIRKIEQIENEAAPEVKQWAAAGEVSINFAAQFIALPEEAQQKAITAIG